VSVVLHYRELCYLLCFVTVLTSLHLTYSTPFCGLL
jgi:hypothetical protein